MELSWIIAARVGDARQINPHDITLRPAQDGEVYMAKITFRRGKGASWHGPFTIGAVVSKTLAKELAALKIARSKETCIFTHAPEVCGCCP